MSLPGRLPRACSPAAIDHRPAIHANTRATPASIAYMFTKSKSQCQIATEARDAACAGFQPSNNKACAAAERNARQKCLNPRPRPGPRPRPWPPRPPPYPPRPLPPPPPQPYPPRPPVPGTCSGVYRSTVAVFNATPCMSSIALVARTRWGGYQTLGDTPMLGPNRLYRYVLCGLLPPSLTILFRQFPQGQACRWSVVSATLYPLPATSSVRVPSSDGSLTAVITPAVQGGEAIAVVTNASRPDLSDALPVDDVSAPSIAGVSDGDSANVVYLENATPAPAVPAGGASAIQRSAVVHTAHSSSSTAMHSHLTTMCGVGTAML